MGIVVGTEVNGHNEGWLTAAERCMRETNFVSGVRKL